MDGWIWILLFIVGAIVAILLTLLFLGFIHLSPSTSITEILKFGKLALGQPVR